MKQSQPPGEWPAHECVEAHAGPQVPLVVLWGDSHAAHLRYGFDKLKQAYRFRLAQMTGEGCPPFVNVDRPNEPFCHSLNDFYLSHILALKPDLVVIAAAWYDQGVGTVAESIRRLKKGGIQHVVVIGPVPRWEKTLPELLVTHALSDDGKIPTSLGAQDYIVMSDAELKSLVTAQGASYIPAMNALCSSGQCVTMAGHGPQYVVAQDYYHLTDPGSAFLMQKIGAELFSGTGIKRR